MEEKYNLLSNPKFLIGVQLVFFIIAVIDQASNDATSFQELGPAGKFSVCVILPILAYLIGRYLLVPIWARVIKWFNV